MYLHFDSEITRGEFLSLFCQNFGEVYKDVNVISEIMLKYCWAI